MVRRTKTTSWSQTAIVSFDFFWTLRLLVNNQHLIGRLSPISLDEQTTASISFWSLMLHKPKANPVQTWIEFQKCRPVLAQLHLSYNSLNDPFRHNFWPNLNHLLFRISLHWTSNLDPTGTNLVPTGCESVEIEHLSSRRNICSSLFFISFSLLPNKASGIKNILPFEQPYHVVQVRTKEYPIHQFLP